MEHRHNHRNHEDRAIKFGSALDHDERHTLTFSNFVLPAQPSLSVNIHLLTVAQASSNPAAIPKMEITASLLALSETRTAYERATRHPFLRAAGQLTLSSSSLASWLTQDRLYALCGYSAFLGTLIAKVPAPEAGPDDAASKQHRRRLTVLAGAMANIDREVGFFEDVARQNNLDLATRPTKGADEESKALANPITRVSGWGGRSSRFRIGMI